MKKRLIRYLSLFSIAMCIVITVTVSTINYSRYAKAEKYNIKQSCGIIADLLNKGGETNLTGIKSSTARITIIAQDGVVKFDTDADVTKLNNHNDRVEVVMARENGVGDSQRYSNSLNKHLYYYAIVLENGDILRVSKAYATFGEVVLSFIPFVAGILVVFVSLSFIIVGIMTKRIISPINNTAKQLDVILSEKTVDFEELSAYDEFIPFVRKLNNLNSDIKKYTRELRAQNQRLDAIMDSMQEGLIVLDKQENVLSVNQGAKAFYDVSDEETYLGKKFINLCRDKKINEAIANAISTKEIIYIDDDKGNCFYKYYFSPVLSDNGNCKGLIILIINATAEMKSAQLRRNFAANVSHELKTPLTSIAGFAEMLKSSMISEPEDVVKTSTMIYKESSRLISLVEDIIRLSQIESGADIEVEPVDLKNTVEEVISATKILAQEKGVTFRTKCESAIVNANPSSIYELIYNICENAIKYNQQDGVVKIIVSQSNSKAIITVSDTGIGIPHEHIDRIFERFYRVDKSRSKQTGGTGLGLSIVKHIVEDLDGTISISSKEGSSTTIQITLPM